MLVTFKSKAAADVTMYEVHAKRLLDLLGKEINRGVITAAETGHALEVLGAQVEASRLHPASDEVAHDIHAHHSEAGDDNSHEPSQSVSFSARAFPLMEMLRAAHEGNNDILWGV